MHRAAVVLLASKAAMLFHGCWKANGRTLRCKLQLGTAA